MKSSVLANREEARQIEAELQYDFVTHVLENIGIPMEILLECFPEGGYKDFEVNHRIKLREYMRKFDVRVVDDRDGGIKIYVDQEVIAEWKKCRFLLREDRKGIYPAEKLYSEIQVEFWTIFDDEPEEEDNE